MYRILLVEDNTEYAGSLIKALEMKKYELKYVESPIAALTEFAKYPYDLVISDYMMPGMNGIELLAALKDIKPEVKCIILTGFPQEEAELEALDLHVNRYLSKDKSIHVLVKYAEELLYEVQDVSSGGEKRLISKDERIMVDLDSREVYKNGELVEVTRKEYDLLVLFMENKGVALNRETISEKIWTTDIEDIDLRAIDGHIKRLRAKLKLFSIVSVRGYGYKWNE